MTISVKNKEVELTRIVECSEAARDLYRLAIVKLYKIKSAEDAENIAIILEFLELLNQLRIEVFRHLQEQGFDNPKSPIAHKAVDQYLKKIQCSFDFIHHPLILAQLSFSFIPIKEFLSENENFSKDMTSSSHLDGVEVARITTLFWLLPDFLPQSAHLNVNELKPKKSRTIQKNSDAANKINQWINNIKSTAIPEIEKALIFSTDYYESELKKTRIRLAKQHQAAFLRTSQHRIRKKYRAITKLLLDIQSRKGSNALTTRVLQALIKDALETSDVSDHNNPLSRMIQELSRQYRFFSIGPTKTQKTLENMLNAALIKH